MLAALAAATIVSAQVPTIRLIVMTILRLVC